MPITFPLTLPTTPGFVDLEWMPDASVSVKRSPFTMARKVNEFTGRMRAVTIKLPPMSDATAKPWVATFRALDAGVGTFYLQNFIGKTPLGNVRGKGYVAGASQTGADIATDGWVANTVNLFKQGDWISISDRLYEILADVNSDATGAATLTVWPDVQTAVADNTEIKWGANARGIFYTEDIPPHGYGLNRLVRGISFSAYEVVS